VGHDNPRMVTLRTGSKGDAVATLQLRLRRQNLFTGPVNGVFGATTAAAVKRYEAAHNRPVDGFVTEAEGKQIKADSLKKPTNKGFTVNDRGTRVLDIQHDLLGLGFYQGKVNGKFDAATKSAVRKFEAANGLRKDGVADLKTEGALDRQMKKLTGGGHPKVKAPPSDYHRVVFRGGRMNVRTQVMVRRAELYLKQAGVTKNTFSVTQGSYSKGVSASAGTHDGGGALDISVRGRSQKQISAMVKALRQAGFAAWARTPADGFTPHIHAIAIGDREAAPLAKRQMQNYFAGRNGLANNGIDRNRNVGRPFPNWAAKFD
jgi:peptidoglycan hydrolase-like protein with peptidoglycan-binding domain